MLFNLVIVHFFEKSLIKKLVLEAKTCASAENEATQQKSSQKHQHKQKELEEITMLLRTDGRVQK